MLRALILITCCMFCANVFANEQLINDIESFARDVNAKFNNTEMVANHLLEYQENSGAPQILIFISFSMSDTSIKQWAAQAEQFGAKLVLRGFVGNSFKETVMAAHRLFAKDNLGGFIIDPFAFQKYQIQTVPAVVVEIDGEYDVVFGDIGLFEALKIIKAKGALSVVKGLEGYA